MFQKKSENRVLAKQLNPLKSNLISYDKPDLKSQD